MNARGSTLSFTHFSPRLRTVLTDDSTGCIRDEMATAGLERAMVVCSPRQKSGPAIRRLTEGLDQRFGCVFDGATPHPTLASAEQGAAIAKEQGVDCLIALGGGGSSDLAKGIALWLAEDGDMRPISFGNPNHKPGKRGEALPIFAIPTTASGAELTPGFGQRDASGRKLLFRDERVFARLIVLDAVVAQDTTVEILVPTCMNAIAHCIEALYSTLRDPISDSYAVSALAYLDRGLRLLSDEPDGLAPRREILVGANLAGRAIINARTCLHHAACHVLGAAGVSHGHANSIILPHAIRFNGPAARELLRPAEQVFGVAGVGALADAIDDLCGSFGIPRRLREVGISSEQLPHLAEHVTHEPGLRFNPRQPVTVEQIVSLLEAAW